MKMFMFSLELDARWWFKNLPSSSITSLKYFQKFFHLHYKIIYWAKLLLKDSCDKQFELDNYNKRNERNDIYHKDEEDCDGEENEDISTDTFSQQTMEKPVIS